MQRKIKKKVRNVFLFLFIILIISLVFYLGVAQTALGSFKEGYLPYGESINQITDGKYWNFVVDIPNDLTGNDFEIKYRGWGTISGKKFLMTSTEDFSERVFKSKIKLNIYKGNSIAYIVNSPSWFQVYLLQESEEIIILTKAVDATKTSEEGILEIIPSPLLNKVNVYWAGEKVGIYEINGPYKIGIKSTLTSYNLHGNPDGYSEIIIENPSYKSQFGCLTEPGEQTYVRIYNEGQIVDINDFNNFKKFCLDEMPLKIYTPMGVGTDKEILGVILEGELFNVPTGQIWSISYIGDKGTFQTECEEGKVYFENENECLARAMVTFECPLDSISEDGICIVETLPTLYTKTTIDTHQQLEESGKFRFTDIFQDEKRQNIDTINIFNKQFTSDGVNYIGSDQSGKIIEYSEEPNNFAVSFSYDGQSYTGNLNDEFNLNDKLKMKITSLESAYNSDDFGVFQYKINYDFIINTDFITLNYIPGIIKVNNNFKIFDGGLVVTKKDVLGKTSIETFEKTFNVGSEEIIVNIENIEEIKARPYIKIDIGDYKYKLDATNALNIGNLYNITSSYISSGCSEEDKIGKFGENYYVCRNREWTLVKAVLDLSEEEIANLQSNLTAVIELTKSINASLQEQKALADELYDNYLEKTLYAQQLQDNITLQAYIIKESKMKLEEMEIVIQQYRDNITALNIMITELTKNNEERLILLNKVIVLESDNEELLNAVAEWKLKYIEVADYLEQIEGTIEKDLEVIELANLTINELKLLAIELDLDNKELATYAEQLNLSLRDSAEIIVKYKRTLDEDQEALNTLKEELNLSEVQYNELLKIYEELQKQKSIIPELDNKIYIVPIIIIIIIVLVIILKRKSKRKFKRKK